jgi:hypothetical protein
MQITVTDNFVGQKVLDHRVQRAILTGLSAVGDQIKNDAIPITPMLTGALRGSAKISLAGSGAGVTSMQFSFNTGYAGDQERGDELGYRNYTTPGTGPRFLRTAFQANEHESVMILSRAIAAGLKGMSL